MNKKRLALFLALTVIITCFIFYNSLKNSEESNKASDVIEEIVEPIVEDIVGEEEFDTEYFVRKGAHITEFFILGLMVFNALTSAVRDKRNLPCIFGYGLFYVLAVAVTDEFIQSFSDRTSSVIDVLIDFSGASAGFAVATLVGLMVVKVKEKIRKGNNNGNQN